MEQEHSHPPALSNVDLSNGINPSAISISAWVNGTSFPNAYNAVVSRNQDNSNTTEVFIKSTGKLAVFFGTAGGLIGGDGTGTHTLSTGTWYYISATYDTTNGFGALVNGAADITVSSSRSALKTTAGSTNIGRDPVNAGRSWNGNLDEVRVASVKRSADWITTEYNNQSAPGTFETLGTEVAVTTGANGWFYLFP